MLQSYIENADCNTFVTDFVTLDFFLDFTSEQSPSVGYMDHTGAGFLIASNPAYLLK